MRLIRVILTLMGLVALEVGIWAQFFPKSFYDDFPGSGRVWVSVDGQFNEHLVRDVGGLNLALAAVTFIGVVTLSVWVVRSAAVGWLLYGLPHFLYHLNNLDPYETSDQVAQMVALALPIVGAVIVLVLSTRVPAPDS